MKHLLVDVKCDSAQIKEKALIELKNVCCQCKACELAKTRTSVVFSDGSADAKIMLIGEAPGADEDASGTPFVGRAGQLLNKFLEEAGIEKHSYTSVTQSNADLLKTEFHQKKKNLPVRVILWGKYQL